MKSKIRAVTILLWGTEIHYHVFQGYNLKGTDSILRGLRLLSAHGLNFGLELQDQSVR